LTTREERNQAMTYPKVSTTDEFVFYDGPPFANGLPHYGHLLTGYVKDVVPRYQTMRGQPGERRFGWDTHGLPAEMEAEKELGISGRPQDHQRVRHRQVQRRLPHLGAALHRRVGELRHPPGALGRLRQRLQDPDLPYMESVMWAFKQLWDKGLVYEGFRVLPYCWRCETPLSNHETRMDDDVYRCVRTRRSPSDSLLDTGEKILAWTTTPWTLPSNLALAVGTDIDYVVVESARSRPARPSAMSSPRPARSPTPRARRRDPRVVGARRRLTGRPGRAPLHPAVPVLRRHAQRLPRRRRRLRHHRGRHRLVHMAPAFGEDDKVCNREGIEPVVPVGRARPLHRRGVRRDCSSSTQRDHRRLKGPTW
jgi:isoleucyl-tRNA synthetase